VCAFLIKRRGGTCQAFPINDHWLQKRAWIEVLHKETQRAASSKKKNFYLKNTVLEKWQLCRGEMRFKVQSK
jgi:hypothetical protein